MQGERYTLSQQVLNFETTLSQLRTLLGGNLTQYLAKSIAVLVFGSNDYINNYLLPSLYPSSYTYNPQDYANLLLNRYARQIIVTNIYYAFPIYKIFILYMVNFNRCDTELEQY